MYNNNMKPLISKVKSNSHKMMNDAIQQVTSKSNIIYRIVSNSSIVQNYKLIKVVTLKGAVGRFF